ncbi:MAG TPA: histidine kinase dimerization/phosphoacceptor domain-containing protein [Anaerolineales bacterium]|nr:histidine kinase dimerization/phosphoacceptor domain-containing protein [Anaerolineales bacterium]
MKRAGGYQGSYLIGLIIIGVVALRDILFYQSNPFTVILLLAIYGLLYVFEPWLSSYINWHKFLYFPVQTAVVIALTNLRPFTDISSLLYVPLCIQVMRAFSRRSALIWIIIYVVLLAVTLILGMGWQEGLALILLYLAVCTFLISYDFLYSRTQADQAESQRLLADLQSAHRKLQEYAAQAEELAAARERNRLARELHDSVSQAIFSITLTSQSARLLLDREPARVPEQIDRLQAMTEDALSQLRALIAQLRPPQS